MYEIAIIGAGPAGATLARLVGKHYRVLLMDKRPLGRSAGAERAAKCCALMRSGLRTVRMSTA